MRFIRVSYRFLYFIIYTACIVAEVYWHSAVLHSSQLRVMAVRRRWARRVLRRVGVVTTEAGRPPDFPCLLLANHRSYLDPILILRNVNAFPVAKAELADWPLIGKGARWAGILYVQRSQGASRISTLKAIADTVLVRKFPVILFPEGTTSDLPGMLPFKSGGIRAAVKYNLPVVPVAICFSDKQDFWVGEVGFLKHAWQRFQKKKLEARVIYGPKLEFDNSEELEGAVRNWIETQLMEFSKNVSAVSP
ncbi:MAG: lysophospholipid acyltransferase family protein [Saprospiraceae bacterium]